LHPVRLQALFDGPDGFQVCHQQWIPPWQHKNL
jgi:hypothetical protein